MEARGGRRSYYSERHNLNKCRPSASPFLGHKTLKLLKDIRLLLENSVPTPITSLLCCKRSPLLRVASPPSLSIDYAEALVVKELTR